MAFKKAMALLLGILITVPVWAVSNAVGTVQNSRSATVHGSSLVGGTTLYSGDIIRTEQQGSAWVSLPGGAKLFVAGNSTVQIRKSANGPSVQLEVERGAARFRSTQQAPIEAILADAVIRPAEGGSAYISVLSSNAAIIGAEKGSVVITTEHDGRSTTVPEGSAVNVSMASGAPSGVKTAKSSRGMIILVGAFIAGGLVGGAVAANLAEPSHGNPVSPFQP
jgi:ferric-dicitrate binding protein FerR (iron transport regulator)